MREKQLMTDRDVRVASGSRQGRVRVRGCVPGSHCRINNVVLQGTNTSVPGRRTNGPRLSIEYASLINAPEELRQEDLDTVCR